MKRALLSVIIITFLLSSCITGGNVFSTGGSSGSRLLDALSERPGRRTEERPIEEVLSSAEEVPEEDIILEVSAEEEPEPMEEPATEVAAVEEPAAAPIMEIEEPVEKEPLPLAIEEADAEPELPVEVETEVDAVPEPEPEPDIPEPVVEVPVETAEEVPVEEPPAVEEEPVAVEPEVIIVEAEPELMHYGMEGWMLRLLVVSVAAIILFTAATAIRSGARRPMTKAVSLLLAVVFTAVPWAITILVAGASWFWCVYLVMLLSYIIFRSGNR